MSNTLPWRTLATPATPSDLSAPSIALPCGSRMPVLSVTVTRAFIALLARHVDSGESGRPQPGPCGRRIGKPSASPALHLECAAIEPACGEVRIADQEI